MYLVNYLKWHYAYFVDKVQVVNIKKSEWLYIFAFRFIYTNNPIMECYYITYKI